MIALNTVESWLGAGNQLGIDIWNRKYRQDGEDFPAWLDRVSGRDEAVKQLILARKFLFGGRILSNRGLPGIGVKSTYSNCYVIAPPEDSIESIFEAGCKLARTFSYGGGCGIDLSKLAPAGAKVNNTAQHTSGAVSFMDFYSMVTGLIGQNGRRGALMLSMDCSHPDVEAFVRTKSDLNRVTKANLSVRITDDFMRAVAADAPHRLRFYRPESGETIERDVSAKELFHLIAEMNWDYAEPGALFWDRIEGWNLLSDTQGFQYAGVNPCAEEPLPAGGSCLLGSINLAEFVLNPFTDTARFDFGSFSSTVHICIRALNDVLDEGLALHPLDEQRKSVEQWRQIGLGIFGLADMLIKLGLKYGSHESLRLTDAIGIEMVNAALQASALLARDCGAFPAYDSDSILASDFFRENASDETAALVRRHGLRNSQLLTVAPTGTISTMLGVSGGIEPIFANTYERKTESLHGHDKTYKVYTPLVKTYMEAHGLQDEASLPPFFVTAQELDYHSRLDMQSVLQQHIDASISSTVNVPNTFSVEDTERLYMEAWEKGLKGVTIFRAGCQRTAILTTADDKAAPEDHRVLGRGHIIDCTDDLIGKKRKLTTGCGTIHCQAWFDPETGELMETFIPKGSTGGCRCNEDAVSRMVSLSSRGGIPIEAVTDQLLSCGGCDSYRARTVLKHDTSKGSSCPTAIGYALLDMYHEVLDDLGLTPDEPHDEAQQVCHSHLTVRKNAGACPECGEGTIYDGGCVLCRSCGWSKCS